MPLVEEVFRLSGTPKYNFVPPIRYGAITIAIRTPGRPVIIEGPSGIGKTTVVTRILEELGISGAVTQLSARREADVEYIQILPDTESIGTVVVDDFHRLPTVVKEKLSDYMKVLADSGDEESKLILIGINKAGDQLVRFAHDLGMRLDVFRLEANPPEKIQRMIELGEEALNISITDKEVIAARSQGSFHIAQVLCHNLCVEAGVIETQPAHLAVNLSGDVVTERVMDTLSGQFMEAAIEFARGSKIRREGRAPYLHMLKWLSESEEWSLDLADAVRAKPELEASVNQVIKKGYLEALLEEKAEILGSHFHYQPETKILSVEDPKIVFFLRNLVWRNFSRKVGYTADYFRGRYDIALSFAGPDRDVAELLFERLTQREVAVFYDKNEQHRIIAENIEDYLGKIYRTEANYVVPFLSPDYPTRIWTKFESDNFRERFGQGAVIGIRYRNLKPGYFSDEQNYGTLSFDPAGDVEAQIEEIAEAICQRLQEDRETEKRPKPPPPA